jgi:hypothetical protein
VTGDEKREIPAAWLTPLDEPVLSADTPRTGKAKRRAGKRGKPTAQAPVDVSLDDLRKG